MIGCPCPVCTSSDPRNRRTRSSLYLSTPEVNVLVDTGPDLREQALRERLTTVDHVLYTHDHVDHIVGFDEIRAFCWRREDPMPLHGSPHTLATLERMFPWAFGNTARNYVRPDPRPFHDFEAIHLGKLTAQPFPVVHGASPTHGFLFTLPDGERVAYAPDVKTFPPESLGILHNVDLLIIDALRPDPHPTHQSLDEALALADSLAPARTALTHLTHDLDFATTSTKLPANTFLATDGLTLTFPS
ncbi:MBL fold metallo-hydrolase [Roseibacillus ishigakijimensis]|uniref:MBL fold metallo-hydrolase n=2 Tax=Roseibacillus ishigakijimensis TaxID=454146 RepID=A0A934RRM2_9BACT|nr:MBL fold metallo-hydrolase [Roseibacillus ishigakijimensis]